MILRLIKLLAIIALAIRLNILPFVALDYFKGPLPPFTQEELEFMDLLFSLP